MRAHSGVSAGTYSERRLAPFDAGGPFEADLQLSVAAIQRQFSPVGDPTPQTWEIARRPVIVLLFD